MPAEDMIDVLLLRAVRAGLCPGCVAGWSSADGGIIRTASAGQNQITAASENAEAGTWYDLASLTKPLVVTTLFLLARRESGLDLNSTVGSFYRDAGRYQAVTLENLLTHTSGLPGWVPLYALTKSHEDIVPTIVSLEPTGRPGATVEYSCPGFILLGKILERVLGLDLASAFTGLVAGPLGLSNDLSFKPSLASISLAGGAEEPGTEELLVKGLGLDPERIPGWRLGQPDDGNARFLDGVSGNAGLFGTIRGVLQLAREFLPSGGLLLKSQEAEMASVPRTPDLNQSRGLGWQIASSPGCSAGSLISPDSVGHTGFTGTSLWIDRQNSVVMSLLSNRHHPGHRQTDLHPVRRRFHNLVKTFS